MRASAFSSSGSAPAEVSDLVVVDEVVRGNREMFEVLVRRYNQQLFRVGFAYLKRREPVEDAMQNTYMKAFVNLGRFQREATFSTWITRIMINECLMLLRRGRGVTEEPLEAEMTQDQIVSLPQGATQLTLKEMKVLLEGAIARLPRTFRTVYMLREVQQMSTAEAAAALCVTEQNVKVMLHRARERLKAELLKSAAGVELFSYRAEFCDPLTKRVMAAVLAVA